MTLGMVVLGDNDQDDYESLKPWFQPFVTRGLNIRALFVPLTSLGGTGSSDPGWVMWALEQGHSGLVFLALTGDAPPAGPSGAHKPRLPVLYLSATRSTVDQKQADIDTWLSYWAPVPGRHSGRLECTLLRSLPRGPAHALDDVLVSVNGDLKVLDRLPFVRAYLDQDGTDYTVVTPRQEFGKLRNQLFEKDMTIKRLQRNEKRYRKYFEDDITGDFLMDLEWRVLDCNRAFSRIFGFPSVDYALGFDLRQLFTSEEERDKVTQQFTRLHALDYYELELVRPDGQSVHIIANLLGIRNEQSELSQVRGFLFDNTPRKNLEKQLRESQKMEGLGRLAGGIAHDFNNLLTVINGYAEMLLADLPPDYQSTEELGEILQAGLKASDLTRQLLAFSRQQVLTPQVLDLGDVVSRMQTMLQRLMTERVRLEFRHEGGALHLRADKGQLEQVVLNLVLNARDAMPQGGDLTVSTGEAVIDSSRYDSAEFILPGTYVTLSVKDTGVGMEEEVRKRIFEPFFTTKPQGKGTGLGLAMVYGIVQQSGGTLRVESTPGQGSLFTIFFEALPAGHSIIPGSDKSAPVNSERREHLVLVEDEPSVRDFVTKILRRAGFEVTPFADGSEAWEYLQRPLAPVHLVLSDIIMPRMTGPELFQKLQGQGIDIPFLYMSGYTDDEIIRHGVQTRQMEFIHKPFKSRELLTKVTQVLDSL